MADAVQHPVVNAPIQPPPDFPVTWDDPADERLFWMLDLIHCPEPAPALSFARMRDIGLAGINAAGRDLGAPTRAVGRWINTYFYRAGVPVAGTPEELAGVERTSDQKVRAAVARLGETWEREWLPEIQRHLASGPTSRSPRRAGRSCWPTSTRRSPARRIAVIHLSVTGALYPGMSLFEELYGELFGDEDGFARYRSGPTRGCALATSRERAVAGQPS
jgi:hypothetical protein